MIVVHVKDRNTWNLQQLNLLLSMINQGGFSYAEISQKVERTVSSVKAKISSMGIHYTPPPPPSPPYRPKLKKSNDHKYMTNVRYEDVGDEYMRSWRL